MPASEVLTILHFNDVYNIEACDVEPLGGAARFVNAFKQRQDLSPLVLFSGDIFNPSIMSVVTKGEQMIPIINALNIQACVYGNHDFDFGVDRLEKLVQKTTCPWLLSNVIDNLTGLPLAGGKTSLIIDWQERKIGLLGLVESEWLMTLSTIDSEDVTVLDFVDEGLKLAQSLREQGAEYIIALTHMRWPNDLLLAEKVPDIDLVLGGHDHDYGIQQVNGRYVIKSGSDFRNFSEVMLTFNATPQNGSSVDVHVQEVTVDSSIDEDAEMKVMVQSYVDMMGSKMDKVLGTIDVDLDGRFSSVRTQETNLGNFICDIMLSATEADVALLNSGTLRSDRIHPRGAFKLKDLLAILPLVDPVVVINVTGSQLYEALENSVSQFPKHEGRFAQISGLEFTFDPDLPAMSRIDQQSIYVQKKRWEPDKVYKICTKQYLAEGKDGYDCFKTAEVVVNEEQGPRLSTIVQNHFKSVLILQGKKKAKKPLLHRQSIISTNTRRQLIRQHSFAEDDELDVDTAATVEPVLSSAPACTFHIDSPRRDSDMSTTSTDNDSDRRDSSASSSTAADATDSPARRDSSSYAIHRHQSLRSLESMFASSALAPRVEGRIRMSPAQRMRSLPESTGVVFGL